MHKSPWTAHALCFLSTCERVGSTNSSWAETISVTKATREKTRSFKNFLFQWLICLVKKITKNQTKTKPKKSVGSTEFSAFHSCLIFSPRSNCHGKWKSHHVSVVLLDHILLDMVCWIISSWFSRRYVSPKCTDWSQYSKGDYCEPHRLKQVS